MRWRRPPPALSRAWLSRLSRRWGWTRPSTNASSQTLRPPSTSRSVRLLAWDPDYLMCDADCLNGDPDCLMCDPDCLNGDPDCLIYGPDCLIYGPVCLMGAGIGTETVSPPLGLSPLSDDTCFYGPECLICGPYCLIYESDCLTYDPDCLIYCPDCLMGAGIGTETVSPPLGLSPATDDTRFCVNPQPYTLSLTTAP